MRYQQVLKILGILTALYSITLIPPAAIAYFAQDGEFHVFARSLIVTLIIALLFWMPVRNYRKPLGLREGFLAVVGFWVTFATIGSLPFLFSTEPDIAVTDAFFESMSGLTTTGATVITGIENLPISIKYYRQQMQWLGGMGIIVLAVAVLPMLGIGGMQLFRAEIPGPMKYAKLTPRITETAKALWYIYLGLTVLCALGYLYAGMSLFDAITHSFSTIAIGGFSTYDDSFRHFNSGLVNAVAIVFMILSGMNYALHFIAYRGRTLVGYARDIEVKTYLSIIGISIVVVPLVLIASKTYGTFDDAISHGIFQVVSTATTTGFTTTDFSHWPLFLPAMLLLLSIMGGCAGSTAGGLKIMRVVLLFKQGHRETIKLVHPDAIVPIRMNNAVVPDTVVSAVWGFFALYVLSFVVLAMLLLAAGNDLVTAYSTVTACLNNLGPALGDASQNYASLNSASKWVLSFAMLLGRLELVTFLVLITTSYWRD